MSGFASNINAGLTVLHDDGRDVNIGTAPRHVTPAHTFFIVLATTTDTLRLSVDYYNKALH